VTATVWVSVPELEMVKALVLVWATVLVMGLEQASVTEKGSVLRSEQVKGRESESE